MLPNDQAPQIQQGRRKKCSKCGEIKQVSEFPRRSDTSDGRGSYCNDCRRQLHKDRRLVNINHRIRHHIATRVEKQLNAVGHEIPSGFTTHFSRYMGYTVGKLRKHLHDDIVEREGISLKEALRRGYHIDHIHPLSLFPIDPILGIACPNFRLCWAITNQRLIPAADNLAKGAKVIAQDPQFSPD